MPRAMKVVGGTDLPATEPRRRARPSKTVTQAAQSGSEKELLVALRGRLATAVESPETPPRDLAALTRRLMDVSKELRGVEARESEEAVGGDVPGDEEFDPETV